MTSRIPKLRFSQFEGNWSNSLLEEQAHSIVSGKTRPKSNGNYLVYGSTGVLGRCDEYSHDGEYILVARVGANAGKVNRVTGKFGVTDNTLVIDLKKDLEVAFCEASLKRFGLERLIFGSGQPLITGGQLKSIAIAFPSLPEQQKIVAFLSTIDQKIHQLTRKKDLLEQYKKGVMQQLFSGKIRFKDEKGMEYPKWEERRLEEICEINPASSQLPDSFIYIDLESVQKGALIRENRIDRVSAPSRAQRRLVPNDILYQTVRPYQMNNYLLDRKGDYVASTGYAQLRPKEDAKFIYQALHTGSFVGEVLERCTGTSFPAISSRDLGKIEVRIPVREEQEKIAVFLSLLDKRVTVVNNQLSHTEAFKRGLLQQMFV